MIPTLAINNTRGLRYAVSFDDETPQIVDMSRTSGSGSVWSRSVLRNYIDFTIRHTLASAGEHTLKLWMEDPGMVLHRLVIATGDLPYTYGGPPETAVENFGAVILTNGQSVILSTNQTLTCDSLTNNGTLTLLGAAQLNVTGPFVNNGVLDLVTWQGTLPAGFVNHGTVLDHSTARITGVSAADHNLNFTIYGCEGHGYQVQQAPDFSGFWTNVGALTMGANRSINFEMSNGFQGTCEFYRVRISP